MIIFWHLIWVAALLAIIVPITVWMVRRIDADTRLADDGQWHPNPDPLAGVPNHHHGFGV